MHVHVHVHVLSCRSHENYNVVIAVTPFPNHSLPTVQSGDDLSSFALPHLAGEDKMKQHMELLDKNSSNSLQEAAGEDLKFGSHTNPSFLSSFLRYIWVIISHVYRL